MPLSRSNWAFRSAADAFTSESSVFADASSFSKSSILLRSGRGNLVYRAANLRVSSPAVRRASSSDTSFRASVRRGPN
ncbi:hypothetical protein DEO72_LG1g2082 [Vigna unguiculata]|uniref:Uncharacterized protein n=1 Tax=Vigna unguiculata TaxID=3917 RepID=A0A4D6KTF1_VIGUN|nr:hypothetical protein DEO72_LG1g2082 [Vigna unguiculata]